MNEPGSKETVGFHVREWWDRLPASSRRRAAVALAVLAVIWAAGALHAPSTVDGIARLEGFWRLLFSSGMGGFSFLWHLLKHMGTIEETMQRPALVWLPLAAAFPALLAGLYLLSDLPVSEAYAMKKRLKRLAEAQGRLEPEEAAKKFAIEQGLPLVNVVDKKGKPTTVGLEFKTSEGHAMVIAPTQTGKGLHLTETLLRWPGPALVVDPKREQIERTAYARSRLGPVYTIPGHSVDLAHYYRHLRDHDEARELHYHLLRPWESQERIFADKALSLFLGAGEFAGVADYNAMRLLLDMAESNLVEALTALRAVPGARRRVDIFTNGLPVNACHEDRFVTSAWGHFTTQLLPYQKHVDTIAPKSQTYVIPAEWVRQNATIYVTYALSDLQAVSGVVAAIIAALLRYQIQRRRKDRLLVAIDELPSVRLHNIVNYQPICAGYQISMLLYAQDVAQLDELYKETGRRTLISNCRHQLWYPPEDPKTAREMSDLYGVTLKASPAHSVSTAARQGQGNGAHSSTRSSSDSWSWREAPALLPGEMRALPDGQVLALTHSDRNYVFLGQRLNPVSYLPNLPPPDVLFLPRPVYGKRHYPDWDELATRALANARRAAIQAAAPKNEESRGPAEEVKRTPPEEEDRPDSTQQMK